MREIKMKEKIIEVENLCRDYYVEQKDGRVNFLKKKYKKINAVNNISFSLCAGERVGFIGPNGAGKSTTIKTLVGILHPSSGCVKVFGKEPYKFRKENANYIGVVFGQKSQLWWDLPVIDTFKLLKKIYKIPNTIFDFNINRYINYLQIDDFLNQPVRQLSLGQRMRAEICAALLHNPQILFLDEPTIGLDIVVKKQIREMIKKINEENGVTVLLTTHDLQDIEAICDRIILINHGEIIIDDLVDEVKNNFKGLHAIEFLCRDKFCYNVEIEGVVKWSENDSGFIAYYHPNVASPSKIIEKVMRGYTIENIRMIEPTIDEIIEKYYTLG